jgi:hypothetical protein
VGGAHCTIVTSRRAAGAARFRSSLPTEDAPLSMEPWSECSLETRLRFPPAFLVSSDEKREREEVASQKPDRLLT